MASALEADGDAKVADQSCFLNWPGRAVGVPPHRAGKAEGKASSLLAPLHPNKGVLGSGGDPHTYSRTPKLATPGQAPPWVRCKPGEASPSPRPQSRALCWKRELRGQPVN